MLRNYATVAFRNLVASRLYSTVNIVGLAVGLAAAILILLFVQSELGYDRQWRDAERVHRLNLTFLMPGREPLPLVRAQGPAKEALTRFFPEIEVAARLSEADVTVRARERLAMETVVWADPEVADIFDFEMVAGDLRRALSDSSSLIVSESFARRVLGAGDPMGRVVSIAINQEVTRDYRVAAVMADLGDDTVLAIDAMVAIAEADFATEPWRFASWFSANNMIFFKLAAGAPIAAVEARLGDFADASFDVTATFGAGSAASDFAAYSTQPLADIQLRPSGIGEMKPTGDIKTVILFASLAILVVTIACINFMNLTTARSTMRAREVALRKVLGASRKQVVVQFLGESVLVAFAALLIALALVEVLLPRFSAFLGAELTLSYGDGAIALSLFAIVLFVGLVGGIYPALVVSGFRPVRVLKANRSAGDGGSVRLRSALVVFQFAVSIGLIAAAGVVWLQMRYIADLDPGYTRENMLVVRNVYKGSVPAQHEVLRNEIRAVPGVAQVAYSGDAPLASAENNAIVDLPGVEGEGTILIGTQEIDLDFRETYEIALLAGRDFSPDLATDALPDPEAHAASGASEPVTASVIVNVSALARFGYGGPEEAIGKEIRLSWAGTREEPVWATLRIIGVVPDFHFQSLKKVVRPEMYLLDTTRARHLTVRFTGDPEETVERVSAVWRATINDVPFEHEFVAGALAREFEAERRKAVLLAGFAVLAVVVACLGLYGLASFTVLRRTREIGLRKVMGASVAQVVRLLVWQFSAPVLLANLLAWPTASWLMLRWLQTFPYRIDGWLLAPLCIAAGGLALVIAWLTVGGNASRVARANPVHALRYE